MKARSLSKPLQAALTLTTALTAIALLKPDVVDLPVDQTPAARASQSAIVSSGPETPWVRLIGDEWQPSAAEQRRAADAAVAAASPIVAALPPMTPPKPTAPDPALAYLGRIEQDERRYVFLGRGKDPQVVEIGAQVDPQWKVEKATATEVELRYLPLNEIRSIPVGAAP